MEKQIMAENALIAVRVDLGEDSYDILIGDHLLQDAASIIYRIFGAVRLAIVTDEIVAKLYAEALCQELEALKFEVTTLVIAPGEASKTMTTLETVVNGLLAARLERGDVVIALGGGVIGDITGFASAVTRRGMRFIQIPTTLLAQVDSSVGGKTGVNSQHGKNLIGAFHQPGLVLADTATLDSLPLREYRAGYAEILKYGCINDLAFFEWLEANFEDIFKPTQARTQAVAHSCRAKAEIVSADEKEIGQRALLNLGHTFGHALEAACGYDSALLIHGEGVAIGLMLAAEFSHELGLTGAQTPQRIRAHLERVGLPSCITHIKGLDANTQMLLHHIAQDKKVERSALTFILMHNIGESFIAKGIETNQVKAFLDRKLTT